jgi:hypothetical protein
MIQPALSVAGKVCKDAQEAERSSPGSVTEAARAILTVYLTDWHFEELLQSVVPGRGVLPASTTYDIPTACRRGSGRVVRRPGVEAGHRGRRAGSGCPELTVALNGDFLTGTLHGLERHSDAPNVVRAAWPAGT